MFLGLLCGAVADAFHNQDEGHVDIRYPRFVGCFSSMKPVNELHTVSLGGGTGYVSLFQPPPPTIRNTTIQWLLLNGSTCRELSVDGLQGVLGSVRPPVVVRPVFFQPRTSITITFGTRSTFTTETLEHTRQERLGREDNALACLYMCIQYTRFEFDTTSVRYRYSR